MTSDGSGGLANHAVVSREEWITARKTLLAKEKEFTRLRDDLSRQRRALPWVKVDKPYVFDGSGGKQTLAQLFEHRSQLAVYHFMFSPDWEQGCKHCSFWADHFDGMQVHLNHRDVTMIAVSRAPLAKIEPFRKRMGWKFKWVSSFENDFNYDYNVSLTPEEIRSGTALYNYSKTDAASQQREREGASIFYKDESGCVYHTYSCYARGIDVLNATYHWLDLVPRGRDEDGLKSPQNWVQFHDRYASTT